MSTRLRKSKCLSKPATKCEDSKMNIFSMIKFYESIPDYDTIRHLPCYDFLERLNSIKRVHMNLSNKHEPVNKEIASITSRPKSCGTKTRRKSGKSRKCSSASKSTSLVNRNHTILENLRQKTFDIQDCGLKRSSTSNSSCTTNLSKSCHSLREKLNDVEQEERYRISNRVSPSPRFLSPKCRPQIEHEHFHGVLEHPRPRFNLYEEELRDNIHYRHHQHHQQVRHKQEPIIREKLFRATPSPCGRASKFRDECSPTPILNCRQRMNRAKSCPKDWTSNYFMPLSEEEEDGPEEKAIHSATENKNSDNERECQSKNSDVREFKNRTKSAGKVHNKSKHSLTNTPCGRKSTPSTLDDCARETQMVRSNLAANLRQTWSRKKLMQMSTEKINNVSLIPKCHQWNVRKSPAWQSFNMEDTTTEKFIRTMARKEEQKMRQLAHSVHMNRMRKRVKSAQLLLEGRALSAK